MLALVGKTCSGKTTIEEVLKLKHLYNKIISYTSREPRINEEDRIDYNFITENRFEELKNNDFFAEHTKNYGNLYGIAIEDYNENSVVVVDKKGLKQLRNSGVEVKAFYLYQSHLVRFRRMIERKDKWTNILKRTLIDDIKFIGARRACDISLKSVDKYEVASAISMSDNLLNFASDVFKSAMTRDIIKEGDK